MNIVMVGYFGFGNLGDDVVAISESRLARTAFPNGRVTILSGPNNGRLAAHADRLIPWNDTQAIESALDSADLVLVGGGGILAASLHKGGLIFERPLEQFSALVLSMPWLCWNKGCVCVAFNCGSYGYVSPQGEQDMRFFGALVDRVYMRDLASADIVGQYVDPEKLHLSYDSAFALPSPSRPADADRGPAQGKSLFLTVRSFGDNRDTQVAQLIADAIRTSGDAIGTVRYLVHDEMPTSAAGDVLGDGTIVERIAERCDGVRFERIDNSDIDRILQDVSACDVGLNMRYHGCIISMLAHVPTLSIYADENDPKFKALFDKSGSHASLFLLDRATPHSLAQRLGEVIEAGEDERARVASFVQNARRRVREVFAEAAGIRWTQKALPYAAARRVMGRSLDFLHMMNEVARTTATVRDLVDETKFPEAIVVMEAIPKPLWTAQIYYLAAYCHHNMSCSAPAEKQDSLRLAGKYYQYAADKGFNRFWVSYNKAQMFFSHGLVQDAIKEMKVALDSVTPGLPAEMPVQASQLLSTWEASVPSP